MIELYLSNAFFKISKNADHDMVPLLLSAVHNVLRCNLCALWKLNSEIDSISILAIEPNYKHINTDNYFVQSLNRTGFIDHINKMIGEKKSYFEIYLINNRHLWDHFVSSEISLQLNLSKMICIPIDNRNDYKKGEGIFDAL